MLSARCSHAGALTSCELFAVYLLKHISGRVFVCMSEHEAWSYELVVRVIEKALHCMSAGQKNC